MAFTMTLGALLGVSKTGLASVLRAQPVDTAGTNVGAAQAGFIERGTSGNYMVTLTLPDGHRGGCDVYATSAPTIMLTFVSINPEEFERVDAKVSEAGDALLDLTDAVEANLTVREYLRLSAAVLLGKTSGGGAIFRDTNDTKARITSTLDANGNRVVISRDSS